MLGHVPRKVGRDSLVVALRSMGYRTKGETFEVLGYRELRGRRRFHAKVETFGGDMVPKEATIDLHLDRMDGDLMGRHGYETDGPEIQDEMDRILRVILTASTTDAKHVTCPECGKSMFTDHFASHLKIEHRR
ncbi:MAG TPA: hypothetical protein VJ400_06820 [Thermoplasmata archaeon]|nr:hypothetical protein [Thermoplasmata archaeon]